MNASQIVPKHHLAPGVPDVFFRETYSRSLFTHYAITVLVSYVPVGRVSKPDRHNAVTAGLIAGDPAVPVVIP